MYGRTFHEKFEDPRSDPRLSRTFSEFLLIIDTINLFNLKEAINLIFVHKFGKLNQVLIHHGENINNFHKYEKACPGIARGGILG